MGMFPAESGRITIHTMKAKYFIVMIREMEIRINMVSQARRESDDSKPASVLGSGESNVQYHR